MNNLLQITRNAQKIQGAKILVSIYLEQDVQQFILDLNRYAQLFNEGVNIKDEPIGFYSKATEQITGGRKKAGSPYTLKDTGDFYSTFGIKLNVEGDVWIVADTIKDEDNLLDIDKDILGLTVNSTNELIKKITPLFIQGVKEQLLQVN